MSESGPGVTWPWGPPHPDLSHSCRGTWQLTSFCGSWASLHPEWSHCAHMALGRPQPGSCSSPVTLAMKMGASGEPPLTLGHAHTQPCRILVHKLPPHPTNHQGGYGPPPIITQEASFLKSSLGHRPLWSPKLLCGPHSSSGSLCPPPPTRAHADPLQPARG